MKKVLATSVILASVLAMSACEKESVEKAEDARDHSQQAQEKLDSAHKALNSAEKEQAKAAEDTQASKQAKAEEDQVFVPTSPSPQGVKPQAPGQ